jgi:hypothetical protein
MFFPNKQKPNQAKPNQAKPSQSQSQSPAKETMHTVASSVTFHIDKNESIILFYFILSKN